MKTNAEIAKEIIDAKWGEGDTSLVRRIELALDEKDRVYEAREAVATELIRIADEAKKVAEMQERLIRKQLQTAQVRIRESAHKIYEYLMDDKLFR